MSAETQTLIRNQFETKFFGPVNVIKAVLPSMRVREKGHVVVLSDVSEYSSGLIIFRSPVAKVI